MPHTEADLLAQVRTHAADAFARHPAFEARLHAYFADFWHSYRAVYPEATAPQVLALFDRLIDALDARDPRLAALDQARAADPAWFQRPEMVGMMGYVDRFAGTLAGVTEHIPYLQELGVTYLHLMPLLRSRDGPDDGGYAVSDYRRVDPRLGTMDDLRALAARLHDAGIHLVVDFVMNHTAREHAWAEAARAGDAVHQAFYFTFPDRRLPDAYERTLPEVFPDFAPGNFTFEPEIGRWVWTTFYPFQWDLNYTNPEVFAAMLSEMLFLANAGVDVLRLDAVPFLWKRMGTNCQNQPEAVDLLAAYRALARMAVPGVLFKAEAIVAPDDVVRYLGVGGYEGKACDVAYHATLMNHLWHALASENTHLLRTTLRHLPAAPRETTWINYARCHDDIGWGISDANAAAVGQDGRATRTFCADFYAGALGGSYAEGYRFQPDPGTGEARTSGTAAALTGLQKARVERDDAAVEAALRRMLLLHGVVYFMPGIPLLYSGDELGQLNDLAYLEDPLRRDDNRWIHRPRMDWGKAEQRHVAGTVEHRLFHGLRRLAAVRRARPALHGEAETAIVVPESDALFVVHRHRRGRHLLLAANFARGWEQTPLERLPPAFRSGHARDVLSGERLHFSTGTLAVPPYGCLWLEPMGPPAAPAAPVPVPLRLYVETVYGEEVYVSGSAEALGAWRPEAAAGPLDPAEYPFWTGEVMVPAGTVFAYRWLKKRGADVVAASPEAFVGVARAGVVPGP